jgi:tetratricopeptide (TPR) repeat protein
MSAAEPGSLGLKTLKLGDVPSRRQGGVCARPQSRRRQLWKIGFEEMLSQGNELRDARRFAEAEAAYGGILKIKPKDGRAAYGLGNIYFDQQRWDEAERNYR